VIKSFKDRSSGATREPSRSTQADRKGPHSIRINPRWRVCFVWTDEGPAEIEIVDCH
jgi:plasmid maintenance system killer protein